MQVNELVTLIETVSVSGVKYFSYHKGSESIVISKRETEFSDYEIKKPSIRTQSEIADVPVEAAEDQPEVDNTLFDVTAPNVGTVLLNDIKTGEPVVAVGDTVEKGQLLFVIESMKLFIDVAAPISGRIAQICVDSQQAVEFGSVIMKIETDE